MRHFASYMQIVYTGKGMMQTERTRTHTHTRLCAAASQRRVQTTQTTQTDRRQWQKPDIRHHLVVALSPISVSVSCLIPNGALPWTPPAISRALSPGVCFSNREGNHLIPMRDTQYQQTILHALQRCLPSPPHYRLHNESGGGELTWAVEGYSKQKMAFGVLGVEETLYSVLFFF